MACTKPLGATAAARKNPLGATELDRPKLRAAGEMDRTTPLGASEVDRPKPRAAGEVDRTTPLGAAEVDRRLRQALHQLQLAERNAVLWFAEVLKRRLFKDLGFSSIYQYAGEALGFSPPRTAQFIRLCESLEGLPGLKQSVATGEVSWTKAREVAKVATPQTESAWVNLARTESRRQLERRVRLTQTRSRAKRRDGGRQLGLADSGAITAPSPGASQAHSIGAPSDDPSSAQTACGGDAEALPSDVTFAEVPVTLSLRFTPEQYARYEAILEKLRKHGERGAREELILAGLEALLVDAGSGAAESEPRDAKSAAARGATSASAPRATTSPRDAKSASANDAAPVSPRQANLPAARKATAASLRDAAPVSPRNLKAARQIPAYQIVVQQCEDCGRARVQTSRGAKAVSPAAAEAMRCDARVLRPGEKIRLGEENRPGEKNRPGERNRATIPPGVRRDVLARDGYCCRTPGCGSARFLEVHHVLSRAAGGSNRPDNLVTLCSACHRLTHSLPLHGDALAHTSHGSTHDQQPRRSPFPRRPHESSPRQPPGSDPKAGGDGADSAGGRATTAHRIGVDTVGRGAGRSATDPPESRSTAPAARDR